MYLVGCVVMGMGYVFSVVGMYLVVGYVLGRACIDAFLCYCDGYAHK